MSKILKLSPQQLIQHEHTSHSDREAENYIISILPILKGHTATHGVDCFEEDLKDFFQRIERFSKTVSSEFNNSELTYCTALLHCSEILPFIKQMLLDIKKKKLDVKNLAQRKKAAKKQLNNITKLRSKLNKSVQNTDGIINDIYHAYEAINSNTNANCSEAYIDLIRNLDSLEASLRYLLESYYPTEHQIYKQDHIEGYVCVLGALTMWLTITKELPKLKPSNVSAGHPFFDLYWALGRLFIKTKNPYHYDTIQDWFARKAKRSEVLKHQKNLYSRWSIEEKHQLEKLT